MHAVAGGADVVHGMRWEEVGEKGEAKGREVREGGGKKEEGSSGLEEGGQGGRGRE